jgi:hypothetical protein
MHFCGFTLDVGHFRPISTKIKCKDTHCVWVGTPCGSVYFEFGGKLTEPKVAWIALLISKYRGGFYTIISVDQLWE